MKIVFNIILFLILTYLGYLLVPNQVFLAGYWWLAIPFVILFGILTSCTLRNLKFTFKNRGSKKGILASIFGLGALQVCGLSAYACSTALGFSLMATILPHSVLNFFQTYSLPIIFISILIQVYSLYQLKCFNLFWARKVN